MKRNLTPQSTNQRPLSKKQWLQPKRLVVKVGTGILTGRNFRLNKLWIKKLVAQIAAIVHKNIEVILITSGAIGAGMGVLRLSSRPRLLPQQQAAAAVGQNQLMKIYDTFFKSHNLVTAQILLTREDLSNRKRYLNAKNTLVTLLKYKVIPIINENDTVSVDEIKFGDNDKLSALVANLMQADLLIILSDVDGLYLQRPKMGKGGLKKTVIPIVERIVPEIERIASTSITKLGTGGMASKVEAAKICCAVGVPCVVANGKIDQVLHKILDRQNIGTLFCPQEAQLGSRKRWIGFSAKLNGQIFVDEGARQALRLKKKSLLAKGIIKIRGVFAAGDTVSILGANNQEFARGLSNYSSEELVKIKGQRSEQIQAILGYKYYDEIVHRDNLVIL